MNTFFENFQTSFELYKQGRYDESLEHLRKAEDTYHPSSDPAALGLDDLFILKATIYLAKQENEIARALFEKALKVNPSSAEACLGLGKLFFHEELFSHAKLMFEWAVKNEPDNQIAVDYLAEINEITGFPKDHNSLYEETIQEEPEPEEDDPYEKAYELFAQKKYEEAIGILVSSRMDLRNKLSSIENFLGFNYLATQSIEKAKEAFEWGVTLNPETSQGYAGLGEIHYLNENDKQARLMFERAVKNNPLNEFAIGGLAKIDKKVVLPSNLKSKQKKLEDFIQSAYEKFTAKRFQESLEDLAAAEALTSQVGADSPDIVASMYNFMGFNHLALMNIGEAKAAFEKALETNPQSSQACAGLGEVFYLNQQDEQAKTMFELAVNNNRENGFALAGLEKVNIILGFPSGHSTISLMK